MHNKKIKGSIAGLALAAVIVGGTFAWLTATEQVDNAFSTGSTTPGINVEENFDEVLAENVVPGIGINKEVQVQNTSSQTSYIKVHISKTLPEDSKIKKDDIVLDFAENLTTTGEAGKWIYGGKDIEKGDTSEGEGWYYYVGKVETGNYTESSLLQSVTLSGGVELEAGTKVDYNVVVEAHNIQVDPVDAIEEEWTESTFTNDIKDIITSSDVKDTGKLNWTK